MLNRVDSEDKQVHLIPIHSDAITEFNDHFRRIQKQVKLMNDEEIDQEFVALKYLFNKMKVTTKRYEGLLADDIPAIKNFFNHLLKKEYNQEIHEAMKSLFSLINKFNDGLIENELERKLFNIYREKMGEKIVINNDKLAKSRKYNFLSLNLYLRGNKYYDHVFFLASPNYYPHQKTVIKASNTYFLHYDIYRSEFKTEQIVAENERINSKILEGIHVFKHGALNKNFERVTQEHEAEDVVLDEMVADDALEKFKEKITSMDSDIDSFPSAILQFKTGEFMLVPVKYKAKVIDKTNKVINKKELKAVHNSDWIIFKTTSDEQYIRDKASEIIGPSYEEIFREVISYKIRLQVYMQHNHFNLQRLRRKLTQFGINVTEQNLRNWIFGDTIAPRSYSTLLEFLDYSKKDIDRLEKDSHLIKRTHIKAGHILVQNIEKEICRLNFEDIKIRLDSKESYNFEIAHMGEFTIDEVVYVDDGYIDVDRRHLYKKMR